MVRKLVSGRDFLHVRDAARLLNVTEQTLRNWDKAGRLRAHRHPINGYRLYRTTDIHALLDQIPGAVTEENDRLNEQLTLFTSPNGEKSTPQLNGDPGLPPCHWTLQVALDPKHRPQKWHSPSSTVRRDWRKFPQEAHVIDASETKYRRLTAEEIAILQGFNPEIVNEPELTERERIGSLGDAVPPPLAVAIGKAVAASYAFTRRTAIEICAGAGGLAEGSAAAGFEHLALIDQSEICGRLLRKARAWSSSRVNVGDVRSFNFQKYRDSVGLLSGGPPCQPWSQGGQHRGEADQRDLLGSIDTVVSAIRPEAFLFENVPGLATFNDGNYLKNLVRRLRHPGEGLRYSVLVAFLNAADFGVPQIRYRLFILGFKDRPAASVSACFDAVAQSSTHKDPTIGGSPLAPWKSIGEAFAGRDDPGGWRRWITAGRR